MNEYERYRRRERRQRLLYAALAWLWLVLGGIGLAVIGWVLLVVLLGLGPVRP